MFETAPLSPFELYRSSFDGVNGFVAGFPRFPRNFSRDVFYAGLICNDIELLESQLEMSAHFQGTKSDAITGEEPGKVHHEMPGTIVREPYYTTYNACDTTSLFIIALDRLTKLETHRALVLKERYLENIKSGVDYIKGHLRQDLFYEFPPVGADKFSLRVTYWKDSVVPTNSDWSDPQYPISYALSHFQAANALAIASELLQDQELKKTSETMFEKGIDVFIKPHSFVAFIDGGGPHDLISSDELHCLNYIPTRFASQLNLEAIENRASQMYTDKGIACLPKNISDEMPDTYHGYVVWPFEQALIHQASVKFSLGQPGKVAERCLPFIESGHEVLYIEEATKPRSNPEQLWSIAAKIYFT